MWKWGIKFILLLAIFSAGYLYGIKIPDKIMAEEFNSTETEVVTQEQQNEYYCEVTLNEIECVANKPIKKSVEKTTVQKEQVKNVDTTYWQNIPPGDIDPISVENVAPPICTNIITT